MHSAGAPRSHHASPKPPGCQQKFRRAAKLKCISLKAPAQGAQWPERDGVGSHHIMLISVPSKEDSARRELHC